MNTLFWFIVALAMAGGSPLETVHAGVLGARAVVRSNSSSNAPTSSARSLFVLHCAGCHGLDGSGVADAQVPDIRNLDVFLKVQGGREFILKVPGVMGSGLSDQDVADVMNWLFFNLVTLQPKNFALFSSAEVAESRINPLNDVAATRNQLLIQIHTEEIRPIQKRSFSTTLPLH